MAADTKARGSNDKNITVHNRDYSGFIKLLKWTSVIVAIISAAVIYIISN